MADSELKAAGDLVVAFALTLTGAIRGNDITTESRESLKMRFTIVPCIAICRLNSTVRKIEIVFAPTVTTITTDNTKSGDHRTSVLLGNWALGQEGTA